MNVPGMMELEIFVVAYRSEPYLPRLLTELEATMRLGARVRVKDNSSNRLTLTALWNDIWRGSDAAHVAILNPDIRPSAGWDEKLMKALRHSPATAVAMPNRYVKLDNDAPLEALNGIAASLESAPHDKPLGRHLEGFYAFVVRRTALEALKGFDERFRFYYADSDFQLRALGMGLRTVQVNHCPVLHVGMVSTREAVRRGDLDRKAELGHAEAIRLEIEARRLRPWHELSDQERAAVRLDTRYNRFVATHGPGGFLRRK